ncbi:unnamed protein product, partial [Prorocentrum cordatum]
SRPGPRRAGQRSAYGAAEVRRGRPPPGSRPGGAGAAAAGRPRVRRAAARAGRPPRRSGDPGGGRRHRHRAAARAGDRAHLRGLRSPGAARHRPPVADRRPRLHPVAHGPAVQGRGRQGLRHPWPHGGRPWRGGLLPPQPRVWL